SNAPCTIVGLAMVASFDTDTSIAIGTDGMPVIGYDSNGLWVAKCDSAFCFVPPGKGLTVPLVPAGTAFPSIAIGADWLPVMSYYDQAARALKVAKCNTRSCAP